MDAYREVNVKFNEFRTKMVDQFILTSQNLSAKQVTSSNSSLVSVRRVPVLGMSRFV
jgi:flagellar hook-associated protein 2